MTKLIESASDWAKTIDPTFKPRYSGLSAAALQIAEMTPQGRKAEIKAFSHQYCFPQMNLEKSASLYLMLRILFDLPREVPRDRAKVFGGWMHPSIGEVTPFQMSWPVTVNPETDTAAVQRFQGYSGKGYDAFGEYEYFETNFPLRSKEKLKKLVAE